MNLWEDVRGTVWPAADAPHGRLPPLLLLLTLVTGLVDAVSYLKLGHVFVANMTGNVVFFGFAIAGASGLSIPASLVAIAAFLAGGLAGGRFGAHFGEDRVGLLRAAVRIQLAFVLVAVLVAALGRSDINTTGRYILIVLLAVAMGVQNSTARRLAVPDMTTTVLTLTLTGIASDSRLGGGAESRIGRRLLAVAAMVIGALVGALLVLKVANWLPLLVAAALLATVAGATYALRAKTGR